MPCVAADDERLVAAGHSATSRGLVPRHEYDAKIKEFQRVVGGQRRQMAMIQWQCFGIIAVVPHTLVRLLGEDVASWLMFAATMVPLVAIGVYLSTKVKAQREMAKKIFAPWKTIYGIDVEWWPGSKHKPPRLSFRLPPVRAVVLLPIATYSSVGSGKE